MEQHVQHEEVTVSAYTSTTESLTITEARTRLAEVIDHARAEHEPVYLTRRGRRVVAAIDDDLEGMLELAEDMADIRASGAARVDVQETKELPIRWDEVKADLGLARATRSRSHRRRHVRFARSIRWSGAESRP